VTADEKVRTNPIESRPRPEVVIAGISADMDHVDLDALAIPDKIEGEAGPEVRAVDIPIDAADGLECFQPVQDLKRSEIARVPQFVTLGEIGEDRFVEKAMIVGEEADSHSSA
jgi:hypothetical protein